MHIDKSKQVKKYLSKLDKATKEKLEEGIEGLKEGKGDVY